MYFSWLHHNNGLSEELYIVQPSHGGSSAAIAHAQAMGKLTINDGIKTCCFPALHLIT